MGIIGPNAKVRVAGRDDHDLAEFTWTLRKEKTPFVPIGQEDPTSYTSGPRAYEFSGTAQSKPGGTWAIDWDSWCANDESHAIVADSGGRKERMIDVVIDEVGNTISRDDGSFQKAISGKFRGLRFE
jgi:hypothetical protein